jgi:hypothetical protein
VINENLFKPFGDELLNSTKSNIISFLPNVRNTYNVRTWNDVYINSRPDNSTVSNYLNYFLEGSVPTNTNTGYTDNSYNIYGKWYI